MATLCSSMVQVLPGLVLGVTSSTLLCSSLIDLVSFVNSDKKKENNYFPTQGVCRASTA